LTSKFAISASIIKKNLNSRLLSNNTDFDVGFKSVEKVAEKVLRKKRSAKK
jgi:hypothetical protein